MRGRVRGYPNDRWPDWFAPTVVDLGPAAYGPFPQSLALTQAGDVTLVPLHGHTAGQLGVVVEDGDHPSCSAATAPTREDLMLRGVIDGPSPDESRPGSRTSASARSPPRPRRSTSSPTIPQTRPAWPSAGWSTAAAPASRRPRR